MAEMENGEIPAEVRTFLAEHIPTVGHMEALALACEHQERAWTADDFARRLYIAAERVEAILQDLARSGLLQPETGGTFRFAPAGAPLRQGALAAVTAYRQRLIMVTNLIHQGAGTGARAFSDAFRVRRRE